MNYSRADLLSLGVSSVGDEVAIHSTVQLFNPANLRIGSHVRIDCFSVVSAGEEGVVIGDHVHLGVGVKILGSGGAVILNDFCGLSPGVTLFTASDDFTGAFLTGPTVPDRLRRVTRGAVNVGRHVIVGAGTVILPNVTLGLGCAIGALSLVRADVPEFVIAAGSPLRMIGERQRGVLDLERQL